MLAPQAGFLVGEGRLVRPDLVRKQEAAVVAEYCFQKNRTWCLKKIEGDDVRLRSLLRAFNLRS